MQKLNQERIMSLQSYEAIYDHGQMKWLGDLPRLEEARVIVTILSSNRIAPAAMRHQVFSLFQ